ncbi:plasmid mobilization relaxosome protein MobC [Cupriavidus basilensis]|uniref:plasmid mobilization relaxosome protein MobC n=1 Tax=Cupriavidus basilensis TaxID=68895 RepID=UPI0028510E5B|nr:plasmid mobilization relaxosome protein MobC [Cupriavidus basilensis]MDR3383930.1 plasmid mobilization relaxosome protein MobC [Cupriavidus basilensis]
MTELRKELKARVQPEVKAAFERRARTRRMTESELLRTLVMAEVGQESTLREPAKPGRDHLNTERVTVRLAAFLRDAAQERARTCGMALSRWVAALVQTNITGLPVLTEAELVVVLAANRELAAIGRNINQIARNLNEAFGETERVKLEKLQELAAAITSERQAIRELVRASRQAWSSDTE